MRNEMIKKMWIVFITVFFGLLGCGNYDVSQNVDAASDQADGEETVCEEGAVRTCGSVYGPCQGYQICFWSEELHTNQWTVCSSLGRDCGYCCVCDSEGNTFSTCTSCEVGDIRACTGSYIGEICDGYQVCTHHEHYYEIEDWGPCSTDGQDCGRCCTCRDGDPTNFCETCEVGEIVVCGSGACSGYRSCLFEEDFYRHRWSDCSSSGQDCGDCCVCDSEGNETHPCTVCEEGDFEVCGSGACEGYRICVDDHWSVCSSSGRDCGTCCLCDRNGLETYDETQDSDCPEFECIAGSTCVSAFCSRSPIDQRILASWPAHTRAGQCLRLRECSHACPDPSVTVECEVDADGDFYSLSCGDCNDLDHSVRPGRPEVCDWVDNDCNGRIDDGLCCDYDGDGWSECTGDCFEGDPTIHPGASEICNDLDDNCDGRIDEDVQNACGTCGPVPPEVCDGLDNDCDYLTDEDLGETTCGIGVCRRTVSNCLHGVPQTCVPGMPYPEVCDSEDNDCDGFVDESVDTRSFSFSDNFSIFDSSYWTLYGSSYHAFSDANPKIVLTSTNTWLAGSIFYSSRLWWGYSRFSPPFNYTVFFRFWIGGGTGADGLAFVMVRETSTRPLLGGNGGSLGYAGPPGNLWGLVVEFDTYNSPGIDSSENHVALGWTDLTTYVVNDSVPELEDTGWHTAQVRFTTLTSYLFRVEVELDGRVVIDHTVDDIMAGGFGTGWYLGFTAATGGATNWHLIDDVTMEVTYWCPP